MDKPNQGSPDQPSSTENGLQQRFGFWDVVAVIVGIVVGTAIFKSPTLVFQATAGPWQAIGVWLLGGVLSLCGALCYAELATSLSRNGGDYEYLGRAYGRWMGFLFAWAQLVAVLSGSIAAMAYAFGDYAVRVIDAPPSASVWLAGAAVVVVSALNLAGVAAGKTTQNLLTAAKVLGLLAIVGAGLLAAGGPTTQEPIAPLATTANLGLAMVFVLYAFGGWNDAAFIAAEVRQPHRNLPRALLVGVAGITVIYVAVNVAILAVLGLEGARQSHAPAADVLQHAVGPVGERLVSCLVAASALGAINGMILTGTRVYARLGADHRVLGWLGVWNQRTATPTNAILTQAFIALCFILTVGTAVGQGIVDRLLTTVGLSAIPWQAFFGGFEALVASTAPVFWSFFLLTGLSLVVLRHREPERARPFRVPLYPAPVIVFCLTCAYMLYSSLTYAGWLTMIGVVPLALGGLLFWLNAVRSR